MTKMAADELGHHKQQGGLVVRDSRINIIYLSPQQPFQQPAAVYNPRNQAEHSLELHAPRSSPAPWAPAPSSWCRSWWGRSAPTRESVGGRAGGPALDPPGNSNSHTRRSTKADEPKANQPIIALQPLKSSPCSPSASAPHPSDPHRPPIPPPIRPQRGAVRRHPGPVPRRPRQPLRHLVRLLSLGQAVPVHFLRQEQGAAGGGGGAALGRR